MRRAVAGLAVLWSLLMPLAMALSAMPQPTAVRHFDIGTGPLSTALERFARTARINLVYDAALVAGVRVQGVSGVFAPAEVLARLLKGSGLMVTVQPDGYHVHRDEQQGRQPFPSEGRRESIPVVETITLPIMTVKDERGNGTRTIPTDVLQRTQAQDMAEVFSTEPSVSIGGGARKAQRIYVRGIEGSNLNISVDGAQQHTNMQQHRGGIGNVEPSLLKLVEVHPGPGADQGPGALGGSIRFETVDAQDLLEPKEQRGGRIRSGYSSADEGWSLGSTAFGRYEHSGFLVQASTLHTEDYRAGGGDDMTNTASTDESFMAKYSLLDHGGHSLRLSGERSISQGLYLWGGTGSDMGLAPEGSTPVHQYSERQTWVVDHRYTPGNPLIDWRCNLYVNDNLLRNETSDTAYSSQQLGGDLHNTFAFNLGPTSHDLTLGVDLLREQGEAPRTQGALAGRQMRNQSENLGLYLQNRMSLGAVGVSFGARLDDFTVEYGPATLSESKISPNVGADYGLMPGLTVFANYGEAVRGSGLIPIGWMANIHEGTNFNDGKPFVPERSQQVEGGIRYRGNGLFVGSDHINAEFSLFAIDLENTIERVGGGGGLVEKIWNNPEAVSSSGWELRFGWRVEGYETTLAFTHIDVEDEQGRTIPVIRRKAAPAGNRLVWDNRWQLCGNLVVGGTMTLVDRLDEVEVGQPERPGYVLVDAQMAWSPEQFPQWRLSLVALNLFDCRYSEQTSLVGDNGILLEPGRDLRLMLSYRF